MSGFLVLVVDDEPLAREMVANLVRSDREIDRVIECGDARRVKRTIAHERPDIVFLDVEMPEVSGVQIASELVGDGPAIVFITAFSEYATQAFDVCATDYVLKPFSNGRLFEALARAKRHVREQRLGRKYVESLSFRIGGRFVDVGTADLIWMKAEDYYVLVHSTQGQHMVRTTLSSLEQRLDPRQFARVHRTAIVNLQAVRNVEGDDNLVLVLSNGATVSVSRSRRPHVEPLLRAAIQR